MYQTMIVRMIVKRDTATVFLRIIDTNAPHETCMVSASDYESEFLMLAMTKRQPKKKENFV